MICLNVGGGFQAPPAPPAPTALRRSTATVQKPCINIRWNASVLCNWPSVGFLVERFEQSSWSIETRNRNLKHFAKTKTRNQPRCRNIFYWIHSSWFQNGKSKTPILDIQHLLKLANCAKYKRDVFSTNDKCLYEFWIFHSVKKQLYCITKFKNTSKLNLWLLNYNFVNKVI